MFTVSVIIPTYCATYVAETLDSVFAQTFTDYEVIVVNDGSPDTDELERILASYRDRIVYIKQSNQGPAGARNTGILHSRADLLAFLDSDDLWLPTFLEEEVAFFSADPTLDLVYARWDCFYGSIADKYPALSQQSDQTNFETVLKQECQISSSWTVVRKQAVVDAGLFDTRWRMVEDYDLWVRMAHRGSKMQRNDNSLGLYRRHEFSLSHNQEKMASLFIEQLRSLPSRLELSDKQKEMILQVESTAQGQLSLLLGKQYLHAGDSEKALAHLKQAYKQFHNRKLLLTLLGLRIFPRLTIAAAGFQHSLRAGRPLEYR